MLLHLSPIPGLKHLNPVKPDLLEEVESAENKMIKFARDINGFLNIIGPLNTMYTHEYGGFVNDKRKDLEMEFCLFENSGDYRTYASFEEANIGTVIPWYPQFYVYTPVDHDLEFYVPTEKEVFNQKYTGEVEVFGPGGVDVMCIGAILVISKSMMMLPRRIKWKGGYVEYAPYNYEFVRFPSDHIFLSDRFKTKEEYDKAPKYTMLSPTLKVGDGCVSLEGDMDQLVEEASDRIEWLEEKATKKAEESMSIKADPVPPATKRKQRNQYSVPKKKRSVILNI